MPALRSLRLQVIVAVVVAAAACAYVASKNSNVAYAQGWALARPGEPWPRVNAEAARICRELRSEQAKIVPLGAKRMGA